MKRIVSVILVVAVLTGLLMAVASAGSVPSTCPNSDCNASIKIVRYGDEETLKVGEENDGIAVYYLYETRKSYSVVCTRNHGNDGYLVVSTDRVLAYYL